MSDEKRKEIEQYLLRRGWIRGRVGRWYLPHWDEELSAEHDIAFRIQTAEDEREERELWGRVYAESFSRVFRGGYREWCQATHAMAGDDADLAVQNYRIRFPRPTLEDES